MAAGRQGLAAQKAGPPPQGATCSAQREQDQTSWAVSSSSSSSGPAQEAFSISSVKLPAWPLAQSHGGTTAIDLEQPLPSQHRPHAAAIVHRESASSPNVGMAQGGRPHQHDRGEDGCEGLVEQLRMRDNDASDKEQGRVTPSSAAARAERDTSKGRDKVSTADGQGISSSEATSCGAAAPSVEVVRVISTPQDGALLQEEIDQQEVVGVGLERTYESNGIAPAAPGTAHELRERPATSEELIGRELYITASLLNHSCRPNCVVVRGMPSGAVRAQRDMQVGAFQCLTNASFCGHVSGTCKVDSVSFEQVGRMH